MTGVTAERIHFLDVSRAVLMLLGIPFHAALIYTGAPWLIDSPQHSAWLEFLPPILNSFRMPGFFLIAGFFAALLLERRLAGAWLRSRCQRLGLPLLTGMALIVPLQNALLRLAPQFAVRMPASAGGMIFSHLWFLPVLLLLCGGLALGWKTILRLHFPDLPIWLLGLLTGIWTLAVEAEITLIGVDFALFDGLLDFTAVFEYAPYFLVGIAARRSASIFARLTRWNVPTVIVGSGALAVFCAAWQGETRTAIIAAILSSAMAAICMSQTLLAMLFRLFDRPSAIVDRLVDASFSIYLFHHPIIVALAVALLFVALPPALEWLLICLATLAISYAMHQGLKRSRLLLLLFNGTTPRAGRGLVSPPSAPRPS